MFLEGQGAEVQKLGIGKQVFQEAARGDPADVGAIGLGKALAVNGSLTKLDLEYNKIGDAAKKTVRTAWQSKPTRPVSGLEI